MPVTNIKSLWTSGNLRFQSVAFEPATTPLIQFGQTSYPVYVKIHNRPALTGNTLEVRARPSSATAEHFAVDSTLDWRPATAASAGGCRALQGVCRLDTGYEMNAGTLVGTYGQVANNGTLDGSGIMLAGLYGLIEDGGTYTAVSHVAALWVDSHLGQTVTAGKSELIYATNNGDTTLDSVLYVYAGNKITNLFTIDTASGMVGDKASGDYIFTATRKVKVNVGGETGYLIVDIS